MITTTTITWRDLADAEPRLVVFVRSATEAGKNGWHDYPQWLADFSDFRNRIRIAAAACGVELDVALSVALDHLQVIHGRALRSGSRRARGGQ